jgi:WD40 repeat protein
MVRIWRVLDWESLPLGGQVRQTAGSKDLAFSPDGALLAARAQLWRVSDWNLIRTLEADDFKPDSVRNVAFSPDSAILATAQWVTVKLWRVADGKFLSLLETGSNVINGLAWSPDGSLLIAAGKTIQLWSWVRR